MPDIFDTLEAPDIFDQLEEPGDIFDGLPEPSNLEPRTSNLEQLRKEKAELEAQPDVTTLGGFSRELAERAAQIPAGAAQVVSGTSRTLGAFADYLDRNVMDLTPGDPTLAERALTRAGNAIDEAARSLPQPTERDLGHDVMQGVGQLGGMLATGAGARALGLGRTAAATAGTLAGFGQEFDNSFRRSRARGDDPDTSFAKALGYGTVASLLENKLGAGRLLRRYFPNPQAAVQKLTALGVSKEVAGNFVAGGFEEGSQQLAENLIVSGTEAPLKDVGYSALVGSLVQGVAGVPGAGVAEGGATVARVARPVEDALPPLAPETLNLEPSNLEPSSAAPVQSSAVQSSTVQGLPPETDNQRFAREQREASAALAKLKADEAAAVVGESVPLQTERLGELRRKAETFNIQRPTSNVEVGKTKEVTKDVTTKEEGQGRQVLTAETLNLEPRTLNPEQPLPVQSSTVQSSKVQGLPVQVEPRHLEAAAEALAVERPPDIFDELDAVTRGPILFSGSDFAEQFQAARELSKSRKGKNAKERRRALDRVSATKGRPADQVLSDLRAQNPKFENWTEGDLFNTVLDHATVRLNAGDANRPEVRRLAEEMARAERGETSNLEPSNLEPSKAETPVQSSAVPSSTVQGLPESQDPDWTVREEATGTGLYQQTLDLIDKGREKLRTDPGQLMEGVTGLPVWATRKTLDAALVVMREVLVRTRDLALAINAGLEYLRGLNLPGYSEGEARKWLTENVRERKFNAQLEVAEELGLIGEGMFSNVENRLYFRRAQGPIIQAQSRAIELAGGPLAAVRRWEEMTNGVKPDEQVALGLLIIRQLGVMERATAARGDAQVARDLALEGSKFMNEQFLRYGTELGQAVSMFQSFLAMTPQMKFLWGRNRIERARQAATNLIAPDVQASAAAMTAINAQGIETATAAPDVQAAAKAATDAVIQKEAETPGTELRNAIRKEVLDELVRAGIMTAREAEITALHLDGGQAGTTLAQKFATAGIADPVTRAKRLLEQLGVKMKQATSRAGKRGKDAGTASLPVDQLAAKLIRQQRLQMSRIIRLHHTQQDATGRSLAEKLAQEAGLPPEPAAKLAEAIRKRFAATVTRAKETALKRLLAPIRQRELNRPGLARRIIEATNAGQLSEQQYWDVVKERLNLPEWSKAVSDDLQRRVDEMEQIPDSQVDKKNAAMQGMLTALDRASGYTMLDLGQSFFITNLMLGYATHKANTLGNALGLIGNAAAEGTQLLFEGRPLDALTAMEAVFRGRRQTAGNIAGVLGSGQTPAMRSLKAEPGHVLEMTQFGRKGGVPLKGETRMQEAARWLLETKLASVLNLWKGNARMMAAEDLLFFTPAYQAKLAILTTRLYRQQGMSGKAARQKASEVLGFGQQAVEAAQQQATREGFTGPAAWRRVAEILEANVPAELRETAREYALRVTLNNKPYGVLGEIAKGIQNAKRSDSATLRVAATAVAPIINIPVNWFNESLNYSPMGFLRLMKGRAYGQKRADLTAEQWRDLKAEVTSKAAIGTMLLAGLALKYWPDKDDDDKAAIAFYGPGPMLPGDREGWKACGNIPYSVRVGNQSYSYALTPFALPLSIVATQMDRYRDAHLYKVPSAQRSLNNLSTLAGFMLSQAFGTMLDQSFMLGISDLMETLREPNPERSANKLAATLARAGTSVVIPQELRAIDKRLDPRVYRPQDTEAAIVQAIPFIRREGRVALNGLGQEVTWPPSKRYSSEITPDPVVNLLSGLGAWPSVPDRHEKYTMLGGKEATDEQYADYVKLAGDYSMRALTPYAEQPEKLMALYAARHKELSLPFLVDLAKEPDVRQRQRMIQRAAIADIIAQSRKLARQQMGLEQ